MSLDDLSSRGLRCLPRNGIRFLGGFHGIFLSPQAQLFRGLVIAPVVCGSGGCMSVRRGDVQIRSIVMVALGHGVLHILVSVLALSTGVCHLTIPGAGQSDTLSTEGAAAVRNVCCFKGRVPVTHLKSQSPGHEQALAARVLHFGCRALTPRVFHTHYHSIGNALAPSVVHLNHYAIEQALAPRIFDLICRDLAPRVFHLNHHVIE
jgi:hypothetical protein